jgi:hypothetical protein
MVTASARLDCSTAAHRRILALALAVAVVLPGAGGNACQDQHLSQPHFADVVCLCLRAEATRLN